MLTIKEAASAAGKFISDILPDTTDHRLEEVTIEGSQYSIVMSFRSSDPPTTFQSMIGATNRTFKTVTVDRATGEAISMKIWKP